MTYLYSAWYVAAWAHEIGPERALGVRIVGEPIAIWRNSQGDLTAFEDRCVHRLAPLSLGRCEGDKLRCMYHGFLYDRTGQLVEIPGQVGRIPNNLRVRAYPIVERHGWVWVWMGDASGADEGLIPPVSGFDRPGFVFGHSQLDYAAEARLVNENLLDLTHTSFLHLESFRLSESWARARPTVTEHPRSVRVEWWIRSEPILGSRDTSQPLVDTYLRIDFFVPGVLLMATRAYPVGTAESLGEQPLDLSQDEVSITSQAITPLTTKTTRYFYIMGLRRRGDESTLDMTVAEKAFGEDKTMIEGQQQIIDATANWRFLPTSADRAIVSYNRLVERLAREESVRSEKLSPNV